MNKIEARTQLDKFLGGRTLTFSFEHFPSGEWIATCDQIPGIMTGGMEGDITSMDKMLRAAIVSAAGVPVEHTDALNFVSLKQEREERSLSNVLRARPLRNEQAQYVVA